MAVELHYCPHTGSPLAQLHSLICHMFRLFLALFCFLELGGMRNMAQLSSQEFTLTTGKDCHIKNNFGVVSAIRKVNNA